MTARLVLALLALTGPANAQDPTGALIDALTTPATDGAALVAALEAQGFTLTAMALTGPSALPPEITDPAYFHLRADVSTTSQPGPLILLECSRIGPEMLPHLPNGASTEGVFTLPVVPVLQWSDTVDFLPGAGSQLRCLADFLPVTPNLDPLPLPDRASVLAAITPRFAVVVTEPLVEGITGDWVLYPSKPDPAPPLPDGPVVITAATLAPETPGQAVALRHEHRGADALHNLQIILHQPPQG